jgi:hypothetical protein
MNIARRCTARRAGTPDCSPNDFADPTLLSQLRFFNPDGLRERSTNKDRLVAASRHLQPEPLLGTFAAEVLVQTVAQLSRVVAHDVVIATFVSNGTTKDLDADMVLGQRAIGSCQVTLADVVKEAGQQSGLREVPARQDPIQQGPFFSVRIRSVGHFE